MNPGGKGVLRLADASVDWEDLLSYEGVAMRHPENPGHEASQADIAAFIQISSLVDQQASRPVGNRESALLRRIR